MIDVTHQINSVRRQVGNRELDAGEGRIVTVSQTYDTDIDDLWDACTNSERIPRWFLPVSGDLRLGGRFQLEGNASGTIERCDPPKSFAATWEFGGSVSWIEVTLTPEPQGGTRFELAHTVPVDDHWDQFGPGATGVGWDGALMGLAAHLTGHSAEPGEAEAWAASEQGKRFMTLSSQRWSEANIEGGADPAQAKAMADRTTAVYTAAPES
jgi:uncharacterized protein YndB with AHSA1/START domain